MVKDWMSTTLITVDAGASLSEAFDLMEKNDVNMLPVLADGKLAGIISSVDLKPFTALCLSGRRTTDLSVILSRVRVEDVMSRSPVTVPLDYTMEEVADVLLKNKVSGAPVVDLNNQLVGVITQTDVNRVFISLTGLWRGGTAFGFLVEDSPGSIREIENILRGYGARLQSILTSYERVPKGYRKVHVRVRKLDRFRMPQLLEEVSQKAKLLYKIDHRENTRELYSEGEN